MTATDAAMTATIVEIGTTADTIYFVLFLLCGDVVQSGTCRIGEVAHSLLSSDEHITRIGKHVTSRDSLLKVIEG
jgi:hypothetical protein